MNPTTNRLRLLPSFRFLAAGLFLFLALISSRAINLPPIWRWSNPAPHGANIVDMLYVDGTYVQVGERGQIFTSDDLDTWIPHDTGLTNALRAITSFNGRVVITGEQGMVLLTDDLITFYDADLNTTNWLEGVAASTNLVVAAGDRAAIYISTNAVNWQKVSVAFTNWLRSAAFGATNTFVVVGERGFIASSQNGTTWTARTSGTTSNLNRVTWLGDRFYAVGDGGKVFSSTGGSTWTSVTTGATNYLYAASGDANSRLVAGNLELRVQETTSWSNHLAAATLAAPAPAWTYYAAAWDGSNHVVAGATGMTADSFTTNGVRKWHTTNSVRTWLWAVMRTPSQYLAVGDYGTLFTSPDGIDWDIELAPASVTNSVLLGVGGSTNFFLVVGSQGTIVWATNVFLWNTLATKPTTNDLQGVCFDGNQFILSGGNGTILTSPTGTNWTKRTTPVTAFLTSVEKFPGGHVAVGDAGVILTSVNGGTNWSRQAPALTTNWLSQVRYLNGTLITFGENGSLFTSSNGTNWVPRNSRTDRWLNAADYLDGVWFIAGNQGVMLVSTDLTNWFNIGTITKKSLYGLVISDDQLITVGSEGVIIRSQLNPLESPVNIEKYLRVGGSDVFLFSGWPDQRFYLQDTGDLNTWNNGALLEFFDSTGTLLYFQDAATNTPTEFFRTVTTR